MENNNNNHERVADAGRGGVSLLDDDTIEWKVVELGDDIFDNFALVSSIRANDDVIIKMPSGLVSGEYNIKGHYVIVEFNGVWGLYGGNNLNFDCQVVEVMGYGWISKESTPQNAPIMTFSEKCSRVVFWGGGIGAGTLSFLGKTDLIIYDVNRFCNRSWSGQEDPIFAADNRPQTVTIAPYLNVSYDTDGNLMSVENPYAYFAVSTTPYAVGMFNYVYGYAWELTTRQLASLEIPTDKTYYLWGRNKNGWYEYLGLICTDGQTWQNAA